MKNLVTMLGLAALLAAMPEANAQPCTNFLTDIENFATSATNAQITMNMTTLTSTGPGTTLVAGESTYSEGAYGFPATMSYVAAHPVGPHPFPATLQGTLTTFFNDHRWTSNNSSTNPFSPSATGQRTVVIFLGDYPYAPIHYAKGDVVIVDPNNLMGQPPLFSSSCQDGLMYGFIQKNQIVAISLNKTLLIPTRK